MIQELSCFTYRFLTLFSLIKLDYFPGTRNCYEYDSVSQQTTTNNNNNKTSLNDVNHKNITSWNNAGVYIVH